MVDLVGIEPTTSSMPWKRAPKLRHRPTGCKDATFLLSLVGRNSSNSPVSGLETGLGGSEKLPLSPPQPVQSGKYFRDREHFRGYPVSKIIGYVGHWVLKPVSVSRALRGSIGFLAALFQVMLQN